MSLDDAEPFEFGLLLRLVVVEALVFVLFNLLFKLKRGLILLLIDLLFSTPFLFEPLA